MNKDDIQLLFEYDRWANNSVIEAVSALTVEQFTRDMGGAFRSLRDTLLHIVSGEWIWLQYWKSPTRSASLATDLRDRQAVVFNAVEFPTVAELKVRWIEVEHEQIDFVLQVTERSLAETMPARGTQLTLGHLMQHLANHSVYHRGQVALMMRQLGAEPPPTDFHVFLVEKLRAAAVGS